MCVVSFIGDHYREKWDPYKDIINPFQPLEPIPAIDPIDLNKIFYPEPEVSKAEFEKLKKEVEELKILLKKAKIYDEVNNEPDCEIEEKMDFLRKVAALVNIDLDDVFDKKKI